MVTLQNYPNINQNTTGPNGWRNCVPTSIDDGLEWLTGQRIGVEMLLAEAYGPNYAGFCSAAAFVASCAQRCVKLFPIDGDGLTLVQAAHAQLQAEHPVIATEPDVWAKDHPDWSHVLSFYREDPGSLTARDPYSTVDVTHSDAEWARLFEFHEIWALERIEDEMAIRVDLNTPGLSDFFTLANGNQWQCKQTGKVIHGMILEEYQQRGWNAMWGLPKSNEIRIESFPQFAHLAGKGIVIQFFERMCAAYDPEHLLPGEPPPNSGAVYPLQLFGEGPGIDPRLRQARAELAAAEAEVEQLKAQSAPVVDGRVAKFEQMKAIATS